MTIGVDYSSARFTPAQLHAAGVVAVGRYMTGSFAISEAELTELVDGGIEVWFVFEILATDVQGGYPAGQAHAQQVNAALIALGLPVSQPVYFAADQDLPTPQTAIPYFQGIANIRPPETNGDYGEGALCTLLHNLGLTAYHWQSESTAFPGNQTTLPITQIQQKNSGAPLPNTDLDLILAADFGQYPRPVTPHPPTTTPEDEMNAVVLPNGDIKIYAAGAGDRAGHLLEFTRRDGSQTNTVIDITDQIGGADPYTVQP